MVLYKTRKKLTAGARTLFLRGTRMWPHIIDEMFWPFAIKHLAEGLNILQIDLKGRIL